MKKLIGVIVAFMMLFIAGCWDPQVPAINDNERSYYFVDDQLNLSCNQTNWYWESNVFGVLIPDENGYYGSPMTTVINETNEILGYLIFGECIVVLEYSEDGTRSSGTFAYRVMVDPNNGWVMRQTCNYELPEMVDICPKNSTGNYTHIDRWVTENPAYETYLAIN
jgi:hypothetical protein